MLFLVAAIIAGLIIGLVAAYSFFDLGHVLPKRPP